MTGFLVGQSSIEEQELHFRVNLIKLLTHAVPKISYNVCACVSKKLECVLASYVTYFLQNKLEPYLYISILQLKVLEFLSPSKLDSWPTM